MPNATIGSCPRDKNGLTPYQAAWVEQYFICGMDATAAVRKLRPGVKDPKRCGFALRHTPAVAKVLEARKAELARVAKASSEEVITRLSIVGRANIKAYLNGDWTLKPLEEIPEDLAFAILEHEDTTTTKGHGENQTTTRTVRIKLKDSLVALDKLARHLNLFKGDEGQTVNVLALIQNNLHLKDLPSEDLRTIAAFIREKLPEGGGGK